MRLKINVFSIFLFLFFLLLNLQTLSIKGWIDLDEDSSIKIYHLFSLFFIACILFKKPDKVPVLPAYLVHYYFGVIVISTLLYLFYPFSRILINYLFAFFVLYIGYYIASILDQEQILKILQQVALLIFTVVIVKLFFFIPEIKTFIKAPSGHPDVFTIYGGGVNLEATWLGLSVALFINRKFLFYVLLTISLGLSILYASRTATVIILMIAGFKFISPATSKNERAIIVCLGVATLIAILFFIDFGKLANEVYALRRFAYVGGESDKGMAGRFAMWRYYLPALYNSYLLGYGAGNSIYAIETISGKDFLEDNIHNLYMQMLLEFGVLGLVLYMISVYNLARQALATKFDNPFAIIIIVYLIASLVQFRGNEAIMWLYIGFFLKSEFSTRKQTYGV